MVRVRGIRVPVGDHNGTSGDPPTDEIRVAGAVREEQERLGEGADVVVVALLHRVPEPRAGGLRREDDANAPPPELRADPVRDRRLPRPVDALDCDETAAHRDGIARASKKGSDSATDLYWDYRVKPAWEKIDKLILLNNENVEVFISEAKR